MTVRIKKILGSSGIFRPGDEIISIDGRQVRDQLDVLFMTSGEEYAEFRLRRKDGREFGRRIRISTFEKALPVFEDMAFSTCSSRCVFCFVDQMAPGMRKSLYRKDDDYRFSFLYGNYITLNDISDDELARIVRYNLSPVYVSVHATSRKAREKLFGRKMKRSVLDDLRMLARGGIEFHAQIVLVPGINDGRELDRTVGDLYSLYPSCRSLAVVPVGLTSHRKGLAPLSRVDMTQARALLDWYGQKRRSFVSRNEGDPFLYMSDEFYLLARRRLPGIESYGPFYQLSNGVGMCRLFLRDLEEDALRLVRRGAGKVEMTVVTGRLGGVFLRQYAIPLVERLLPGASIDILRVGNGLFGGMVGVSGLLGGEDIIRAAKRSKSLRGCLVLPPNCVNHEGVLIDDTRPADIGRRLGVDVAVPEGTFLEAEVVRKCGKGRGR